MSWIDDLEALGEAATPGEWVEHQTWNPYTDTVTSADGVVFRWDDDYGTSFPHNARFVVAAKRHWPKIIAALRAAGATQAWYDAFTAQYGPDSLTSDAEAAFEAQTVALAALSDAVTGEKP